MKKNRKIAVSMLMLAIVGIVFIPSIESRIITKNITSADEKMQCQEYTIDYFEYCIISGKYDAKTSDETYDVIIESDTKSITLTGWAVVLDFGDIPQNRFCSVKTDAVKAETFIGSCADGNISGTGKSEVRIGSYESKLNKEIRSRSLLDNNKNESDRIQSSKPTILWFEYCSIKGTYDIFSSNENWEVIAKSDSKSITVSGLAFAYTGSNLPQFTFCRVKTDEVRAEMFDGFCNNGHIYGTGKSRVEIGSYELIEIESKVKAISTSSLKPIERIITRFNL